ncbi:MAG: hypothetical protein IKS32_10635 [Solobacterium sp.]|nr:hypothetical protein [Solobacterium sp.]
MVRFSCRILILLITAVTLFFSQFPAVFAEEEAEAEERTTQIHVSYPSVTTKVSSSVDVPFSKSWFRKSACEYNHALAQSSIGLAAASFRLRRDDPAFSIAPADHAISFLAQADFNEIEVCDYDRPAGRYTIATIMGHQQIGEGEDAFELVAIGISGQGYTKEWLSNLSIGDKSEHEGFEDAADDVFDRFFGYLAKNHLFNRRIKIWVSGFSRSAAVANLFSAALSQTGLFPNEDVFAYTFATPRTTKDLNAERFTNIFNIVGTMDPVPMVPFASWGYTRYGVTMYTPSQQSDSLWYAKLQKAEKVYRELTGIRFWNNPGMDFTIRTMMRYLDSICPSSEIYRDHLQDRVLNLWENRSLTNFVRTLFDISEDRELITDNNRDMANELLSFVCYHGLSAMLRSDEFASWEHEATVEANVLHEHTPDAYLAWVMSAKDNLEMTQDSRLFTSLFYQSGFRAAIYDENDELLMKIDEKGNAQFLTGKPHYYSRPFSEEMIELELPCDHVYRISFESGELDEEMRRLDEEIHFFTISMLVIPEVFNDTGCSYYVWEKVPDDPIEVIILQDGSCDPLSDDIRAADSHNTKDMMIEKINGVPSRFDIETINFLNLEWREFVLVFIDTFIIAVSLLVLLISWLVGRIRFGYRKRRGIYDSDAKYRFLPQAAIALVMSVYLIMEFYLALYPNDSVFRAECKGIIAVLLTLTAFMGWFHNRTDLNRNALIGIVLITAGDVLINFTLYVGAFLEAAGILFFTWGFVKYRKPEFPQIIWYLIAGAAGIFGLFHLHHSIDLSFAAAILFYLSALAMAITSITAPKRFTAGAFLLFFASLGIMSSLVIPSDYLTVTVRHFIFIGLFYTGLCFMAAGTVKISVKNELPGTAGPDPLNTPEKVPDQASA